MTVLKILTYALVSTWSLVSSGWERKMHPCPLLKAFLLCRSAIGPGEAPYIRVKSIFLVDRCPVTLRDLKPSPPVARAIIHLLTSSGKLHKCQWLFCVFDNTNYTKTLARILNAVCNSNFVWSHNLNVWDEIRDGWVSHGRVLIQCRSQYVSHDCSEPIYYYHF